MLVADRLRLHETSKHEADANDAVINLEYPANQYPSAAMTTGNERLTLPGLTVISTEPEYV